MSRIPWPMSEEELLKASHSFVPQRTAGDNAYREATVRMWRALFLAIGIYLCIFGAECLAIERFELSGKSPPPSEQTPATLFGSPPAPLVGERRDWAPPEWAPWSFLSAGAVIILYALTINRQG